MARTVSPIQLTELTSKTTILSWGGIVDHDDRKCFFFIASSEPSAYVWYGAVFCQQGLVTAMPHERRHALLTMSSSSRVSNSDGYKSKVLYAAKNKKNSSPRLRKKRKK